MEGHWPSSRAAVVMVQPSAVRNWRRSVLLGAAWGLVIWRLISRALMNPQAVPMHHGVRRVHDPVTRSRLFRASDYDVANAVASTSAGQCQVWPHQQRPSSCSWMTRTRSLPSKMMSSSLSMAPVQHQGLRFSGAACRFACLLPALPGRDLSPNARNITGLSVVHDHGL